MYLVTAATVFEMESFSRACQSAASCEKLITGIGPVETAVRLASYLATTPLSFAGVINIGVGGAYCCQPQGAAVLDVCLAEREVLGDLGICYGEAFEPLRGALLEVRDTFDLQSDLLTTAEALLQGKGIPYKRGAFVTVNCVSGTRDRGSMLGRQHQAICENMEGAAVARVCQHFDLPLLELRCISNLVEDRNLQNWQLKEACARCGEVAATVLQGLPHV